MGGRAGEGRLEHQSRCSGDPAAIRRQPAGAPVLEQ